MTHVTKDTLTDAVIATISKDADPRIQEIMTALIRHMHGFVKEVDLSQEEWLAAIEFLYQTGQKTTRKRNEFILLSDTLGVTSLIDLLSGHDEVLDVAAASGPILPGETAVLQLQFRGRFNRLTAVGMLVTTNDAFFGLSNFFVDPSQRVMRTMVPAWDAGSEANNESCDFIPGPPCGNPFQRDTEDAEGFVAIHSGIHGIDDLLPNEWAWQNPVVEIAVIMD